MGLGGVSDVLRGVVVGGAGREVDRFDPLQCLSGLVQVGHRFGVVESRIIENNGYLVVFCFAYKAMARVICSASWLPSMG